MKQNHEIIEFLSSYNTEVYNNALIVRIVLIENLPNITEQIDYSAKMIAYCYGQRYIDMICTLIPSQKGLKLGFSRGVELPDPEKLLEGTGKISRYIVIKSEEQIKSDSVKKLIISALDLYKTRLKV